MKIVGYGTCQVHRICDIYLRELDQFKNATFVNLGHYDFAKNNLDLPLEDLKSADIFIYQPLSEKYGIYSTENGNEGVLQFIPETAIKISFPFFCFDMYPIYENGTKIKCGTKFIEYRNTYSKQEFLEMFDKGELQFDLQNRLLYSISHTKKREETCNVHFSEFLEKYYKTHKLAMTWCHPTTPVYRYIANQIYSILHIPIILEPFKEPFEIVHAEKQHDSQYMYKELGLEYTLDIYEKHFRNALEKWCNQ